MISYLSEGVFSGVLCSSAFMIYVYRRFAAFRHLIVLPAAHGRSYSFIPEG